MNRFSSYRLVFVMICLASLAPFSSGQMAGRPSRSLAGEWRFEMDRQDNGVQERWFSRNLADRIQLPGILQAQGFGDEITVDTPWVAGLPRDMKWHQLPQYQAYTKPGNVKMPYLAQPARHYLGVAWYQREIEIGNEWREKRIVLTLERPRWETTLWVDEQKIGSNRSLVAPHVYDLGMLPPGRHRISVRIDNRMILPYRPDAHSVSDAQAQSWNGITGKIELSATSPVWIEDAQAFSDVEKSSVRIRVAIGNATARNGAGTISAGPVSSAIQWTSTGGNAEIEVPMPSAQTWSEFSPVVQQVTLRLNGDNADDSRDVMFGLREIKRVGTQIFLNGRLLNLRGTHDGGAFPLAGYPATDVESWKRIISICQAWGLNHMRFHSWCPPEAAFTAADELGFYLQPECGMWNNFDRPGRMLEILNDETTRLIKAYGNHPSFILLGSGNEPAGDYVAQLPQWDKKWRELDQRRLYTDGVGRPSISSTRPSTEADFAVSADWGLAGKVRGPTGWFGLDYELPMKGLRIPIIAHEVGQWCAYPDFDVIAKFTGHLRPGNYEIYRDAAAAHGLLENNKRLAHASGRFQLACYKEEIEANLRTPSMSGFQLLDLHDYLGQGFSPIGVLDAFWESKGYVDAKEFRRFCNTTVPLARLKKRIFTSTETLTADVELTHFGSGPLANASPQWRIEDASGKLLLSGDLAAREVPIGKNIPLGHVTADLSKLPAPAELKLVVGLKGTEFENDWNFWVYPAKVDPSVPANVLLTSSWPEAEQRLRAGGKVVFQPAASDLDEDDPSIPTTPIFWNWVMNGRGTTFVGLWCDVTHAALRGFPSAANCDWQWIDVMRGARAMNLDHLPKTLQPIVQPIDEWNRNYKLGLIYECKVEAGKLLVCSADLSESRPTASALRRSVLDYAASDRFAPSTEISFDDLRNQWTSTRIRRTGDVTEFQPSRSTAPEVVAPAPIPARNP